MNLEDRFYSESELKGKPSVNVETENLYSKYEVQEISDMFSEFYSEHADKYADVDEAYEEFIDAYSNIRMELSNKGSVQNSTGKKQENSKHIDERLKKSGSIAKGSSRSTTSSTSQEDDLYADNSAVKSPNQPVSDETATALKAVFKEKQLQNSTEESVLNSDRKQIDARLSKSKTWLKGERTTSKPSKSDEDLYMDGEGDSYAKHKVKKVLGKITKLKGDNNGGSGEGKFKINKNVVKSAAGIAGGAAGYGLAKAINRKDSKSIKDIEGKMVTGGAKAADIQKLEKLKRKVRARKIAGTALGTATGLAATKLAKRINK